MYGIHSWYETNRRILIFSSTLAEGRFMHVRAEDVLNNKIIKLGDIAEWLGLRTDDSAIEAMTHPEMSPFAKLGPAESGIIGGNDHGFLRDPIPHSVPIPNTLTPPDGWFADECIWPMVVSLANRLGYFGNTQDKK